MARPGSPWPPESLQTIYSQLTLLTWYQVILKAKMEEGPA